MSVSQFFLESFDQGVAQFPGKDPGGDLCIVVLRVVIAPSVVLVPADLTGPLLFRSSSPGIDHLRNTGGVPPFAGIETEQDFSVPVFNGKAIEVLQSEQGMHQAQIAVDVRNIQRKRRDTEKLSDMRTSPRTWILNMPMGTILC